MGKHLDKETKYHYVMEYVNGRSPREIGLEIDPAVTSVNTKVLVWYKKYMQGGIEALGNQAKGKKKERKTKLDPSTMDRDELLDYIKIIEETNKKYEKMIKQNMRARDYFCLIFSFRKIVKRPVQWYCDLYGVSRSGYNNWLRNPKVGGNYNEKWLKIIKDRFNYHRCIYGAERIHAELKINDILVVNLNTIKRYMRHMGLRAKIRIPKYKKEIKDTSVIEQNYVGQNYADNCSRSKVYTDTSEYRINGAKVYLSAVIDANQTLLGVEASYRNDEALIQKNISHCVKKIGRKYFIHFDNAAFYKNDNMKKLIESTNGICSYSRPGVSLDNRPIEYLWSILKQEYLNLETFSSLEEVKEFLPSVMFHYNHIRRQKNLQYKTPANARV